VQLQQRGGPSQGSWQLQELVVGGLTQKKQVASETVYELCLQQQLVQRVACTAYTS
jgi:hypothetical protein